MADIEESPRPDLTISQAPASVGILRLRAPDAPVLAALSDSFGFAWPAAPNTVAGAGPRAAWLAPGEWAVFGDPARAGAAAASACAGRLHHWADVSPATRVWRVAGARWRDLLACGCAIDTHPRVFGSGRCARSLLAQVRVLLLPGADGVEIAADASHAGHLGAWLRGAAREFGG